MLLYMVCHGSHQYTPFMLAYIYQHHGSVMGKGFSMLFCIDINWLSGCSFSSPIGSMVLLYMVTFTINISPMLAYIPYMDPMGHITSSTIQRSQIAAGHEWLLEELGSDLTGFFIRHQVKAFSTTSITWVGKQSSPWFKKRDFLGGLTPSM